MQAANSADFAVAQFRYLRDILLVQGRNQIRRQATLVSYVLYKSIMMVLTMFWYYVFSAMSGQKFNLEIGTQGFNIFWTSAPIYCIALFDRDVSDDMARLMPQLYHLGIRRVYVSWVAIGRWLAEAVYESLLITLLSVYSLRSCGRYGEDPGVWWIGAHTLTAVIVGVNVKLLVVAWSYTKMLLFWWAVMLVLWWAAAYIASMQFCEGETWSPAPCMNHYFDIFVPGWQGLFPTVQGEAPFWLLLLFLMPTMMIPPAVLNLWQKRFYPEFRDLCIEAEYFGLPTAELAKWEVPLEVRSLPLLKTAPSMSKVRKGKRGSPSAAAAV